MPPGLPQTAMPAGSGLGAPPIAAVATTTRVAIVVLMAGCGRSEAVQRLAHAGFGLVAEAFEGGLEQRGGEVGIGL